jgi:ATP-dependent exoDNAse (exonuclease V) beta subunit
VKEPVVFGPAARALFALDRATAVSAGAGSGKTTALVELCVRLLSGEATGTPLDPGAIAAITFTEKAAEELVVRLRAAVAERAREAASLAPAPGDTQAWLDRLHGVDRMAAGTIHGFCGRLLREHAPEAGLDPEFTVVDEERAAAWLAAAARAAVVAALDAGRPEARILAAGLGATARGGLAGAVTELVRARATRGDAGPLPTAAADPVQVRAAWERLGAAAGDLLALARASGTRGAAQLLEQVARAWVALEGSARGAEAEPDAPARLEALEEATHGPRLGKADDRVREARDAVRERARELSLLEAERLGAPQRAELARLVEDAEARYRARKRGANAVDFDDLLVLARDLLARDGALRAELRTRFGALLVDEYQDVNGLQQTIFDLLAGPGEPAGPLPVAVGDLKQSIYRFRGADVSVFARLVRRLGGGEGRVLHLTENHRSVPAVLDLVNEVSARSMVPSAGAPPRDDEIRFADEDRLLPRRAEGARPACEVLVDAGNGSAAERRLREADAIVRRIRAIVSGTAGVLVAPRGEAPRRPRYRDVAILFRRLTQIGTYERALRAAGIPYRLARGGGFYQAPEVRDVGELLATLFDPQDALGWAAVLRSPMCAISDGALVLLARGGLPRLGRMTGEELRRELGGASGIDEEEWSRLDRFLAAWRDLRALRDRLPLADLVARAVAALDLDAALLAGPDGERRAVNLEKAIRLAARFEADGGRSVELARHLRALAARPPREPEAELGAEDAVAILSVHQAKGLEWPIVLVPDLGAAARNDGRRALLDGEGRLCAALYDAPSEEHLDTASLVRAREADRRAASAESRRLLYVALTRARDRLVLSGEASRGETWRGLVEAALEARPDLAVRVPIEEAGTFAAGAPLPPAETLAEAAPAPATAPRLAPPPRLAAVRVAVTDLAEYARCPRRHHLARVLRVPEPRGERGASFDDPGRATARGTLAHAMLSETDLGAPPLERRAQLEAAAARRGHDPRAPGVRRIAREISRFLDSDGGRALARAAREGRLAREVPFLLRLDRDGAAAYLVGAIDALVTGRRGEGIEVVDYKYAVPRAEAGARYRLQLLAYALAARRAHPEARVRARLQFLRGDLRSVEVAATERDLERFAREASPLALAAHAGAGADLTPAALARDEARCRADGCGYVGRCFPRPPGGGAARTPRADPPAR